MLILMGYSHVKIHFRQSLLKLSEYLLCAHHSKYPVFLRSFNPHNHPKSLGTWKFKKHVHIIEKKKKKKRRTKKPKDKGKEKEKKMPKVEFPSWSSRNESD